MRFFAIFVATLVSGALPGTVQAQGTPPAAFTQCASCHSAVPGRHLFGPSLASIAGRRAGSAAGYAYSEALRKSGITWNAATLNRWLTSPQKTVPGTKMPFAGLADGARRREIVDYLLTLR